MKSLLVLPVEEKTECEGIIIFSCRDSLGKFEKYFEDGDYFLFAECDVLEFLPF